MTELSLGDMIFVTVVGAIIYLSVYLANRSRSPRDKQEG